MSCPYELAGESVSYLSGNSEVGIQNPHNRSHDQLLYHDCQRNHLLEAHTTNMATDSRNVHTDMDDSAHIDTVVDGGLQAISTTPTPRINNPLDTTVTLTTNTMTLPSTSADLPIALLHRNRARFTDLPVEVLVTIADVLLDRYLETCPRDTLWHNRIHAWRDLESCSGGNLDRPFFIARKINQAMRYATRRTFFRNDPWLRDHRWVTFSIAAKEHRVVLEERLTHSLHRETMRLRENMDFTAEKAQRDKNWWTEKEREFFYTMKKVYSCFDSKIQSDCDMLKHQHSESWELSTDFEHGCRCYECRP